MGIIVNPKALTSAPTLSSLMFNLVASGTLILPKSEWHIPPIAKPRICIVVKYVSTGNLSYIVKICREDGPRLCLLDIS